MAHRLDGGIHKVYNDLLGEIAKAKSKNKKKPLEVSYSRGTMSRDEAVRARHKDLAVAKLLTRDGYKVSFVPEGDEMPRGVYDTPFNVGFVVTKEVDDVPSDEG